MIVRNLNRASMSVEAIGTLVLALLALAFALRSPLPNPGMPSGNGATRMALNLAPRSQEAT